MQALVRLVISALCALSVCGAAAQMTPNKCLSHLDPTGCLLQLAKRNAASLKDPGDQAESVSKVLAMFAELKRTDFELVDLALQLSRRPKLSVEHQLELHTALSGYFWNLDKNRSLEHARAASTLHGDAIEKATKGDAYALATWSCGLIDVHKGTWKVIAALTTAYCTPSRMKSLPKTESQDEMSATLLTAIASWVQSDYDQLSSSRDSWQKQIEALEAVGIRTKSKSINISTQYLKVVYYVFEADIFRRSGAHKLADQALAQAREALSGLEKLTTGPDALQARLTLASQFNVLQDFEQTISILKPISDRFDTKSKGGGPSPPLQVDFLITLAYALDEGGFRDALEAKAARQELRMRQADVLYERYLIISRLEKDKSTDFSPRIAALTAAAEAGHPIAMHSLGVNYANGLNGFPKNIELAFQWYSWAALAGMAGAQNNLGDLYERLAGAGNEIGMALYWYTQAAMQGEPTAYLSLGELFLQGKGVPKSDVTAAVWLSLAARDLPNGTNSETAKRLRDEAIGRLDERAKRYVERRIFQFAPHKQTETPMSDKPKGENWL